MKRVSFYWVCALVFSLFTPGESPGAEISCSVVDWSGHEITSAMTSDFVYLVADIPVKRPKNIRFKTTVKYHSTNASAYSISQAFSGHFYPDGVKETENHRIAIWIPDSLYIDYATIKAIFPGIGRCSVKLEIGH